MTTLDDVYDAWDTYQAKKDETTRREKVRMRRRIAESMASADVALSEVLQAAHASGQPKTALRDAIGKRGDWNEFKRLFDAAGTVETRRGPVDTRTWTYVDHERIDYTDATHMIVSVTVTDGTETIEVATANGTVYAGAITKYKYPDTAVQFVNQWLAENEEDQ